MNITIARDPVLSNGAGTFGQMFLDGVAFGFTVEQPWNGNQNDVSCIPAGDYVLVATGCAGTVKTAADAAYDTIWEIDGLCNRQFRTDIGKRLKKELPVLQEFGYASDMVY